MTCPSTRYRSVAYDPVTAYAARYGPLTNLLETDTMTAMYTAHRPGQTRTARLGRKLADYRERAEDCRANGQRTEAAILTAEYRRIARVLAEG